MSGLEICGANSFLLRDSVCDEVTNNRLCHFDGGDCCREAKNRAYCTNCSCLLDVDQAKLALQFTEGNIKPFRNHLHIHKVIRGWNVEVEGVVSNQVCAVLCLDHEEADKINAWHFNDNNKLCRCGWIESLTCAETLVRNWKLDSDGSNMKDDSAYVTMTKTLPCGKSYLNAIHLIVHILQIFLNIFRNVCYGVFNKRKSD